MSVNLDDLIRKNIDDGSEIEFSGPVDDAKIREAESALGVTFPPSYRDYLRRYGAMEVDGRSFGGLSAAAAVGSVGDVVAFTRHARADHGLPVRYVAIDFQDGDAFLCIDTGRQDADGESPLVLVEPVGLAQRGPDVAQGLVDYLTRYLTA